MFDQLKIGTKILLITGTITISVIAIIGFVSDFTTRNAFEENAYKKLTAVREMKGQQIEDYFDQIIKQAQSISKSGTTIDAMKKFRFAIEILQLNPDLKEKYATQLDAYYSGEFSQQYEERFPGESSSLDYKSLVPSDDIAKYFQNVYIVNSEHEIGEKNKLNKGDDKSFYSSHHDTFHPFFNDYLEKFGFYDIFLIDHTNGRIIYSVFKEIDFMTSLLTGPYKDTNLAVAFNAARNATEPDFVHIEDFQSYTPSYEAPAAFMATPIFKDGKMMGVMAFQMPVDRINDIMTSKQAWQSVGLGDTGETYLVGDDLKLRNQSRFFIESRDEYFEMIKGADLEFGALEKIKNLGTTIGLQHVNTKGTQAALAGETGEDIFDDYRGVSVLSSYRPLSAHGLNWAIMSEIDEAEAFAPFDRLRDQMIMLASALIAITVYISYFFALSLTRPLRFLESAANKLSAGNMDEIIERSSGDEIGDLAENFETMRLVIQKSFAEVEQQKADLEDRVQERTSELDQAMKKQSEQNEALEHQNTEMQTIQDELIESRTRIEESEERVSAVVQSSPDGIITISRTGIIESFNNSAEKIFGYSSADIIGKNIKILMPKPVAIEHDYYLEKFDTKLPSDIVGQTRELEGLRFDGTTFPMELGVETATLGNEFIFIGMVRDITERKALEQSMNEAYQIIDQMPMPVYVRGKDSKFRYVNKSYEKVNHVLNEDIIDKTLLEVFPDKVGVFGTDDDRVLNEGALVNIEETNETENGQVTFSVLKFPLADSNGESIALAGIDIDISERKQAEETIKRHAMEANLLHQATQMATETDSFEGSLHKCINIVCDLTGWPIGDAYILADDGKERLVSAGIWKIDDSEEHTEFRRVSEEISFEMGEGLPGRIWSSGKPAWIQNVIEDKNFPRKELCRKMNIHGAFGFPILMNGAVVAVLEFFSEKIAEPDDRLLDVMATVGAQVGQVLERKQTAIELQKAKDAADEASQTKSAFLANMSHELRTPMNAIIGYAEMLAEDAEEEGAKDRLKDIKEIIDSGEHLLLLVNDVLDISKIEAGKMDIYLETFDIERMIKEVAATTKSLIDHNGNTMEISISKGSNKIHADLTKVRQILFNLVSNAAKFTSDGTITIFAEKRVVGDREFFRMGVKDTGIGIPANKLHKIFEEFSQADESTTRNFGGTGLGLALVRRFCLMMGGDIWVESISGEGSSFIFELPAIVVDETQEVHSPIETKVAEPLENTISVHLNDGMVLVIDDDRSARDLIKRNLESEGYSVILASDGEQGLSLARKHKPSLITLDILMPGRDGWSILQELKDDQELQNIPVIMVSMIGDNKMGSALGAVDHISKPVNREKLKELVARYSSKGTALVVEDNDTVRDITARALRSIGWEAIEAENGAVGIEKFNETKIDLIILDIMMPVMDGFEFVRELRQNDSGRSVPIAVVTAKDLTQEERDELSGSVQEIFMKEETSIDTLVATIADHLKPE